MLLSLKKLIFNNIATFVTEQTVDFSQYDGEILQINGINNDTGGGSGAAKSTVFHANDYLLGINEIPATALQSRLVKAGMYVEGHFDAGGKKLILRRSKKDGLTLKYGDETVSGNVKLAEERLWEIIGIPKKLFKKMIHKKQKEMGFFLKFTAKESYEFLMSALGLENTSEKVDKIDEDIKAIVHRISQLGYAIDAFESSITEIEELQEFEKEPTKTIKKEDIQEIEKNINEVFEIIQKEEAAKLCALEELSKEEPTKPKLEVIDDSEAINIEEEKAKLTEEKQKILLENMGNKKAIQNGIYNLKKKLNDIPHNLKAIESKAQNMKDLMVQKQHLEEDKCPTCMRKWNNDSLLKKIHDTTRSIAHLKSEIIEHKKIVDSKGEIKFKIARAEAIIKNIDSNVEIVELDKKINTLSEKIITIRANASSKASKIENKYLKKLAIYKDKVRTTKETRDKTIEPKKIHLESLKKDRDIMNQSFENYSRNIEMYNLKMVKYCNTLTEKRNNLKDSKNQRDEKSKELAIAEETKRLIKTYTLQIFQDTLNYIGDYATQILADVPNMQNSTIYFEGCKENGNGSVRDEVNAIINMCGYDNVNIKTLSGGERTVIDLAVDLAVIDMVESKAGKGADFFILDEPFTGLEDINITQCLEILKKIDTNKKIIIVDHNPIAKEMITGSIIVEKTDGQSVVL